MLEADVVVIAMGPWSGQAAQWLRVPPIAGRRAHSIVLQPAQPVSAHALFTDVTSRDGGRYASSGVGGVVCPHLVCSSGTVGIVTHSEWTILPC